MRNIWVHVDKSYLLIAGWTSKHGLRYFFNLLWNSIGDICEITDSLFLVEMSKKLDVFQFAHCFIELIIFLFYRCRMVCFIFPKAMMEWGTWLWILRFSSVFVFVLIDCLSTDWQHPSHKHQWNITRCNQTHSDCHKISLTHTHRYSHIWLGDTRWKQLGL